MPCWASVRTRASGTPREEKLVTERVAFQASRGRPPGSLHNPGRGLALDLEPRRATPSIPHVPRNPVVGPLTPPGSESNKLRPALIVGRAVAAERALASGRGVVTVVPLTSNLATVYDFQIEIPAEACGLDAPSKAQCEQVRSISVARFVHRIGSVPLGLMLRIDDALRLHLDL
ncbi:type II toxin-antitoxin system PemK/MazF family toxin [Cellulomonas sp. DKR-3]|uniref:Type II toxin-antitoxin system PemK/MazF family toxin n=1 Tax=Cellulomonas fulva TaxID=2835530 RepID=A0ABS5TUY1_9CELL|nr:type II toxin-antitoxin system PemK/MazF family toxin [Cellulomonas fulva]MBT0992958.1 type II toxin-antitoxin system PemK/MazF family toxin [Cellulomonas fulva]